MPTPKTVPAQRAARIAALKPLLDQRILVSSDSSATSLRFRSHLIALLTRTFTTADVEPAEGAQYAAEVVIGASTRRVLAPREVGRRSMGLLAPSGACWAWRCPLARSRLRHSATAS